MLRHVPVRTLDRDTAPMASRVASAASSGAPELAELEAALADAAAGRRRCVVAGDRASARAACWPSSRRARGARRALLSGDCVELGEAELPYAPLVGALRPLARDRRGCSSARPTRRAPRSPRCCPLGDDGGDAAGRESAQGACSRRARLLDGLGGERPVVLALEDLHWADRSTRDFLAFLSRSLARARAGRRSRTAPTSCTAATRCARCWPSSSARPRAPPRARAIRPRRARRAARRTSSAPPGADSSSACTRARGQPALHRGARGRRRWTAAATCRRRCATR